VAPRLALPPALATRLAVGAVAVGLLLVAEFTVVLWLRGFTIDEYLASRDPVGGTVYILMLGVFASMPLLVARR
jgi:type IV secretory pathway TrbD component